MKKISIMTGVALALSFLALASPPARAATAAEAIALEKAHEALRAARVAQGAVKVAAPVPATRKPVEIRHPDGSVEKTHGDESTLQAIAVIDEAGEMQMHCLPTEEAQAVVNGAKLLKNPSQRNKETHHDQK